MAMVVMIFAGCVAWGVLAGQVGTDNTWSRKRYGF